MASRLERSEVRLNRRDSRIRRVLSQTCWMDRRPAGWRELLSVDSDFILTKSEILAMCIPIDGIHLHPGDSRRGKEARMLFENLPDHNHRASLRRRRISLFESAATH
jgi:hypothetical protein